MGALPTWI